MKIQVAKWGTPKKYLKKTTNGNNFENFDRCVQISIITKSNVTIDTSFTYLCEISEQSVSLV